MWTTHSFLLFLFCTALSKAHPRNAHITTAATKNQSSHNTPETGSGSEATQADAAAHRTHQENGVVMQNVQRPRFLVTYGNVYKPNQSFLSPVDPFQNILLYFLMNFGREMSMSQSPMEENKLRHPAEFFNDPRNKIDDPSKALNPRDSLDEEQNEEVHFFPHVGGTCMCFNNRKQELKAKAPQKEVGGGYCRKFKTETTELKTENHNLPSSNDTMKKSTIAVGEGGANRNNTIIKVLRLAGHNQSSNLEVTTKLTTANKEEIVVAGEEIVVDLQLTPDEGKVTKHNEPPKENSITSGNKTNQSIQFNVANKNKSRHDESYYFLSSSGGTDQRTTASNKLALYLPDANTIQAAEDKQKHLRDSKKRRKRVRRHLEKIEKYLHDNLKRHPVRKLRRNEEGETKDPEGKWQEMLRSMKKEGNNHTDGSNKLVEPKAAVKSHDDKKILMAKMGGDGLEQMSDINGMTNLKSVEEIIKYHNWAPAEQRGKLQGPSRLSTVMPALLGIGTLFVIIGYIMKTKGWLFYNLLSNKPRLVSTEASSTNANELKT